MRPRLVLVASVAPGGLAGVAVVSRWAEELVAVGEIRGLRTGAVLGSRYMTHILPGL